MKICKRCGRIMRAQFQVGDTCHNTEACKRREAKQAIGLNVLARYYSVLCVDHPEIDGLFVCSIDKPTHLEVVAKCKAMGFSHEPLDLTQDPNGPIVDASQWLNNWQPSEADKIGRVARLCSTIKGLSLRVKPAKTYLPNPHLPGAL